MSFYDNQVSDPVSSNVDLKKKLEEVEKAKKLLRKKQDQARIAEQKQILKAYPALVKELEKAKGELHMFRKFVEDNYPRVSAEFFFHKNKDMH